MTGAPVVATWVAEIMFWTLVLAGVFVGALRPRWAAVFAVLWAIGYVALPRAFATGALLATPYLAVLDIVLVLMVVKGDVRLW